MDFVPLHKFMNIVEEDMIYNLFDNRSGDLITKRQDRKSFFVHGKYKDSWSLNGHSGRENFNCIKLYGRDNKLYSFMSAELNWDYMTEIYPRIRSLLTYKDEDGWNRPCFVLRVVPLEVRFDELREQGRFDNLIICSEIELLFCSTDNSWCNRFARKGFYSVEDIKPYILV